MAVPGLAAALGLGSIELHSGLNQPFDARINLVSPTAGEIQSLKVQLADNDAFQRAGIDRPFVLSRLKFEVVTNDSGPDYIHITTREPVREPFLDFLVEADWSTGRLFREYTVLLDPPMYNPDARQIVPGGEQAAPSAATQQPQQPQQVQQAQQPLQPMTQQPSSAEAKPAPAPAAAKPAAKTEAPSQAYSGNSYGPVVSGNTLWSIARETRPDASVSIQQMMLALQRSNPDAFINNNINGLKRGYVLHMPDRQDINSLGRQEALAQVRKEYARWDELKGRMAETAGQRPAGGAAPAPEQPATGAAKGKSELKIVTPEKGAGAGQAEAGGGAAKTGKSGNSLALANEQLQSLKAENADLKDQQSQDAAVVADLQRLIKLKNDELAKLQQSLQKMNAQAQAAAAKPAQPAAPPPAGPKAAPPAPAPMSLTARIMSVIADNMIMIAGALGALVIVILALVAIRRRAASHAEEQALAPEAEAGSGAETEMPSVSEAETELNLDTGADVGEEEEDLGESTMEDHTVIAAAAEEEAAAGGAEEEAAVEPVEVPEEEEPEQEEEEDPLAEVNVFLAYEHFDQAEEFVRDAISREPDNLDFHSKLLEVFYAAGDKAKYEEEARILNEKVNGQGPHWDMAEVMWQEMSPNRALFEEPAEGEDEEKADTTGGGIVDLTADAEGGEVDTGLDFDLGDLSTGGEEEEKSYTDEQLLDITVGTEDESTLDITTSAPGEAEDILDVTAAVGLGTEDGEEDAAGGEDEDMLDLTGGVESHSGDTVKTPAGGGGEDLLDVTAHADLEGDSIDEDLLDVTAATSAGADSDELLEVGEDETGSEPQEENSLDFDLTGLAPEDGELEEESSGRGDTLDIDLESLDSGTEASQDEGERNNVIDFGGSGGGEEEEGGIELDLGGGGEEAEPESFAADSGLDMELTLDEDDSADLGGLSLDMDEEGSEDSGEEQGLEVDFGGEDESGGLEETDAGSGLSIDLEIQEDEPAGKAEPSIDLESTLDVSTVGDEDDEDDGDATMFVPRSSEAQEQSPEDEIATKLDLAKAYVELGDGDSAKSILEEIIADGNADQQQQARELLNQVSS